METRLNPVIGFNFWVIYSQLPDVDISLGHVISNIPTKCYWGTADPFSEQTFWGLFKKNFLQKELLLTLKWSECYRHSSNLDQNTNEMFLGDCLKPLWPLGAAVSVWGCPVQSADVQMINNGWRRPHFLFYVVVIVWRLIIQEGEYWVIFRLGLIECSWSQRPKRDGQLLHNRHPHGVV